MAWRDVKWKYVAIGAVFSLLLFFSANLLWQRNWVERPIVSTLMADPAVVSVNLLQEKTHVRLVLEMAEVEDLASAVRRVRAVALEMQPGLQLEFIDKPNVELAAVYHDLHFALFQSLQQGDYESLAQRVEMIKQREEVTFARLEIDLQDVYLQIHNKDGYLFKVIPREAVLR